MTSSSWELISIYDSQIENHWFRAWYLSTLPSLLFVDLIPMLVLGTNSPNWACNFRWTVPKMAVVWNSIFDHTPSVFALKFFYGRWAWEGWTKWLPVNGKLQGLGAVWFSAEAGHFLHKRKWVEKNRIREPRKILWGISWSLNIEKSANLKSRGRISVRIAEPVVQQLNLGKTRVTMTPHSSTPAWKIPWTEEPGRLQSMGSLRVRYDWATSLSLFTFMHWRAHSSVLAWRIPGTEEPGGLPSVGLHRVRHDWCDSSSSRYRSVN